MYIIGELLIWKIKSSLVVWYFFLFILGCVINGEAPTDDHNFECQQKQVTL